MEIVQTIWLNCSKTCTEKKEGEKRKEKSEQGEVILLKEEEKEQTM